jgi:aspartyl-tRNA(Asn)/glutamyl-tRNA(Gln) amidotransferase subunit A
MLIGGEGMELIAMSLSQAAEAVRKREVSPVELTRACLEQIERLNPSLNAFITVTGCLALEQAAAAEREISAGQYRGAMHGIPVALKDLIDTAGVRTTAASNVFRERVPEDDAEVVRRLKEAGAVLVGKTNLHEFGYGGSGVVTAFRPVRNPAAPDRITGGSSSGSAAAVAAEMCFAALGSDTAGSIREPAALCGVVGLKPSYGLVSPRGVIPLAWSYDHIGPLTRTVRDAAIVLGAIAGYDAQDTHSRALAISDYVESLDEPLAGLRLGVARQHFCQGLHPEVEARFEEALRELESLTGNITEITVPVDEDRTVQKAEAWAFHAERATEEPELYQPETLRRIRAGEFIGVAEYLMKRRELAEIRRKAHDLFRDLDLVVTPTVPVPAPSFAELEAVPGELRHRELLLLRNTRPFSVLGLPAISVPCGVTESGLPVGLQISGAPAREDLVLRLAHAFERIQTD